jgi:hypothetical protein
MATAHSEVVPLGTTLMSPLKLKLTCGAAKSLHPDSLLAQVYPWACSSTIAILPVFALSMIFFLLLTPILSLFDPSPTTTSYFLSYFVCYSALTSFVTGML